MLKGSTLQNLHYDAIALVARMLVAMTIAVAASAARSIDAVCILSEWADGCIG
jgi:hypothetical protein